MYCHPSQCRSLHWGCCYVYNINRCKVKAIQAYHNQTSGFDIPKCEKSNLYCRLQEEDIRVCLQHSFFCLFFPAVLHSISTRHWVAHYLDVYLDELHLELEERLGVSVATSTIWRSLVKGGYSMKKACNWTYCTSVSEKPHLWLTCTVLEWSDEKTSIFATSIGTYEPNQLVFVNESAVDHHTTYREWAWMIHGMKAMQKAFFCWVKSKQINFINTPWKLTQSSHWRYTREHGLDCGEWAKGFDQSISPLSLWEHDSGVNNSLLVW